MTVTCDGGDGCRHRNRAAAHHADNAAKVIAQLRADLQETKRKLEIAETDYDAMRGSAADLAEKLQAERQKLEEATKHAVCLWCGQKTARRQDDDAPEKILEHMAACPTHPMRTLEARAEAAERRATEAEVQRAHAAQKRREADAESNRLVDERDSLRARCAELEKALLDAEEWSRPCPNCDDGEESASCTCRPFPREHVRRALSSSPQDKEPSHQ